MGWLIKCTDQTCGKEGWATNIIDLTREHTDAAGWLRCSHCGRSTGYVEKRFEVQEGGDPWEPFLKGIIALGDEDAIYQPFVFLVSSAPAGNVDAVWFSYYKDLRKTGGRLKLGYGPGGPPVLELQRLLNLLRRLVGLGCLSDEDLRRVLNRSSE